MVVGLDPVLLTVGPFTIRWLGVCWVAAAVLGAALWARELRRGAVSVAATADLLSWIVPGAVVGARAFHVLANVDHYAIDPAGALGVARGGFALWGAIVGGGLAGALVARRRGLALGSLADAAAPWLAFAEAIGRIGCLLDGANLGKPTDLPWGLTYPDGRAQAPDPWTARHPAAAYHALVATGTFLLLRTSIARRLPSGGRFTAWLALHAAARLAIGFVRIDPPFLLGLQQAQWIAIVVLAGIGFVMIRARRRLMSRASPARA